MDTSTALVAVTLNDIPSYLRNGAFYQTLYDCEDDENDESADLPNQDISVPSNCIKPDDSITNGKDLRHLLITLRFWVVSDILESLVAFSMTHWGDSKIQNILNEFKADFPYINDFVDVLKEQTVSMRLLAATRKGRFEMLPYILPSMEQTKFVTDTCFTEAAALHGHLNCLKYLHEAGCAWDAETCATASGEGFLECLQYLHENGCDWGPATCSAAARHGHLPCLKYAHETGCAWSNYTCQEAAAQGHLECLRYAHEEGCPWDGMTTSSAAQYGRLHCLQYAFEQGCECTEYACIAAIRNGHLQCLKYLHEHGCAWSANTAAEAAAHDDISYLQYVHSAGCPWDEEAYATAARKGLLTHMKYLFLHNCPCDLNRCKSAALIYGHAIVLPYLTELGCEWDASCIEHTVKYDQFACLQYLISLQCPWNDDICAVASSFGSLECLSFLHEKCGCALDDSCIDNALEFDKLSCLQYLVIHQCKLKSDICVVACEYGSTKCLSYLHEERGFALTEACWYMAAKNNNLRILEYMHVHDAKCVPSSRVSAIAAQKAHLSVLNFLRSIAPNTANAPDAARYLDCSDDDEEKY